MKLVTALLNFFALSVAIVHPVLGEDDACEGSLMDSMVMPTKAKMRKNAPKPNEARDKALNYTRFTRQRGELVCDPDTGKDPTGTFECKNMNLAAFISGDELGSDFSNNNFIYTSEVWGYVDRRGKEFALVGMWDGVSIVDISVPHKPCVRAFVPTTPEGVLRGDGQYWRDIKVVGDVAYIAADRINNHGIQVVDLTRLENMRCNRGNRGLGEVPKLFPDYIDYDGEWAHNLAVAPSNKITHAPSAHKLIGMGMRGKDPLCPRDGLGRLASLKIYDISGSNALMPKFEDCYYSDAQYVHDAHCILYHGPDKRYSGRNICALFATTEIVLLNLDTLEEINVLRYENYGFVHGGHFSEDHAILYSNDEYDETLELIDSARLFIWSLEDLEAPVRYESHFDIPTRHPSIEHDTKIEGDRIYQAAYTAGARILKITDGGFGLEEIAYFDMENTCECVSYYTCPCFPFGGTWSHFPFPSGITVANSIYEGLFVLRPTV